MFIKGFLVKFGGNIELWGNIEIFNWKVILVTCHGKGLFKAMIMIKIVLA